MLNKKRKIPGMVYIFVSFIPWIVYWVLCGAGYSSGVVASLLLSLLLVTPQINKKDINLMDFVSFFYFFLATVCSFGLNTRVFIAKAVTLLTAAGYREIPARGTEEYRKKKKELAEALVRKAEKIIPELGKHIIIQDAATPKTLERYFRNNLR